jgi:oxalate decarboxylase
MRPSRYWQKISACLNRPLMAFQGRKFIFLAAPSHPNRFPKICRDLVSRHRRRTNFECLQVRLTRFSKGGRQWRIDSTRFPISTTVTGVILDLEPGALRELHWHPNADEWQYVIEGDLSVTMFGSHGRFRTEQLHAGDVGYIPQGDGHSIENVGSKQSRMLIGFNTGIYQAIDLSAWIAGNPVDVLATNFGKPASLFERFPRKDVFISPNQ